MRLIASLCTAGRNLLYFGTWNSYAFWGIKYYLKRFTLLLRKNDSFWLMHTEVWYANFSSDKTIKNENKSSVKHNYSYVSTDIQLVSHIDDFCHFQECKRLKSQYLPQMPICHLTRKPFDRINELPLLWGEDCEFWKKVILFLIAKGWLWKLIPPL